MVGRSMRKEWWFTMLRLGQTILKAIAEYDEDFYEYYIEKYTQYPDEEADKYYKDTKEYDKNANYDDDVDIAEIQAVIDLLHYVITNHHPHKVGVNDNLNEGGLND